MGFHQMDHYVDGWTESMSCYHVQQYVKLIKIRLWKASKLLRSNQNGRHSAGHINISRRIVTVSSQITAVSIISSTVCSDADQRKYQISASLAFVRGIHWWLVNSPHNEPVTRKFFPFDDGIMLLFESNNCFLIHILFHMTSLTNFSGE